MVARIQLDLKRQLLAPMLEHWIELFLAVCMVWAFASSISDAKWVDDSRGILTNLVLGLLFGALLAISRFRVWFCAVYSILLSFTFSIQSVGRVLSSTGAASSFWNFTSSLQLRLWTLAERVRDWIDTYQAGQPVQDTGLFVAIGAVLAWHLAAWLVWALLRQRRAFEGVFPIGIALAINTHLSGQTTGPLLIFIALAGLAQAFSTYRRQIQFWDQKRIDYPYEFSEWVFSAGALTVVVALFVFVSPFVATREGWEQINEIFSRARQDTAETMEQLFPDVRPARVAPVVGIDAATPDMNNIGEPISTSDDLVMYVELSDPVPRPPQAGMQEDLSIPKHYWRNQILATYSGRGWEAIELPSASLIPAINDDAQVLSAVVQWIENHSQENSPPGRYTLWQKYEILANHGEELFSVSSPIQVTGELQIHAEIEENRNNNVSQLLGGSTVHGSVSEYEVVSWATHLNAEQLRTSVAEYPQTVRDVYLQLPPTLPGRVSRLAERIAGEATTAFEKAVLIQNYLRENYIYDLDVAGPPEGRDAVDYFLFEAQKGFCSYYASAMAVMLRSQGVPARVAAGFAMGEYDFERKAYRVPASASHAWVEVYFPEYGWVEFEPTPARSVFVYPEPVEQKALPVATPETLPEQSIWQRIASITLIVAIIVLVGLLGYSIPYLWAVFEGRREGTVIDGAGALYNRVRGSLVSVGISAPASATPYEFHQAALASLQGRPRLSGALDEATTIFVKSTFSLHCPSEGDLAVARRAWRAAFGEWLILWLHSKASRLRSGEYKNRPKGAGGLY